MLYLFSSNAQPQYAQDVLNALGAPAGYKATFRYDTKYLNESARNSWSELRGDVLIHFVLQQSNEYFTPVLFPVRLGKIINTRCEGDIRLVDFTVGDFVSLPDAEVTKDYPKHTAAYRQLLAEKPRSFPLPYDKYAISDNFDVTARSAGSGLKLGNTPPTVPAVFRTITDYLGGTDTFTSARFIYISRLYRRGKPAPKDWKTKVPVVSRLFERGTDEVVPIDPDTYGYVLTAGREYELEFLHSQPHLVATTSVIHVVLDGKVLQAIGPSDLSIASSYDVCSIRIAALPTASGAQFTSIGVRPESGVQGPILDIPVKVRPPNARNAVVATGTAAAAVVVALTSIFTDLSDIEKFYIVAVGALVASFLNTFFRVSTKTL
jgi:hypothetical protein